MILPRRALLLTLGTAILPLPALAQTVPDEAARHIQHLADQAFAVLQRDDLTLEGREAEFRRILSDGFDLAFVGRFVLGRYWDGVAPEQRDEYLELFSEFGLRTYAGRLGGYTGETFTVGGTRPAGEKDVIVATVIERSSGGAIDAEWRVRKVDAGYRIIDVSVAGVSMALNQREEFASVITNHGVDGLLQMLRARVSKVSVASN